MCTCIQCIQWNPDFCNPRFLKPPNFSNQYLFSLDIFLSTHTWPSFSQLPISRTNFHFPRRFEKTGFYCNLAYAKYNFLLLCRGFIMFWYKWVDSNSRRVGGMVPQKILKFQTLVDMFSCILKSISRLLCCT